MADNGIMRPALKVEGGLRIKGAFERVDSPERPLVSIITIAYNAEKNIERTIKSVLGQGYKNIEYIIVDGGSTDSTLEKVRKYEDKIAFFASEKDRGISDAMNKGIALATGGIVGMIHADDWLEPDVVGTIVAAFLKYSPDALCGALRLWNGDKPYYESESDVDGMYYGMSIWHPTVFVRSKLYKDEGVFNLKYKSAMDYDLLMRFIDKRYKILNMRGLIIANMSRGGMSEANRIVGIREEFIIRTSFGVGKIPAFLECAKKYAICYGLQSAKKILVKCGLGGLIAYIKKIRNYYDKRFLD